jgi:hypothetical protein
MRRFVTLAASATLFSVLAFADTFTGRLVDANCANQDKTAKECDAGSATTAFLLIVNGKAYQLDNDGNQKVMAAMKDRADRSANPNAQAPSTINAKISGDKAGDVIKVTTVELQ